MRPKNVRLNLDKYATAPHVDMPIEHKDECKHIDRLITALRTKKKIVVIAGAGISVSAGIPDFRSSTGLFKTLRSTQKLKSSGQQLFDAAVYRDAPSISSFHDMLRTLVKSTRSAEPTPFHHLLARLAKEGRLLRLYSQNVDGIDTSLPPLATQVPVPPKAPWPKTIQVHGGLEKMVCTKCHKLSELLPEIFAGPIPPECGECTVIDHVRNVAGKRSHGIGRLRPRMVLYHEHNPDADAIGAVTQADLRTRPDAVIVIGTSLKVPGTRRIVREMCATVRSRRDGITAWINSDSEPPSSKEFADCFDYVVKGTSDALASAVGLAKWDEPDIDIGEIKEVSEEELAAVKEKSKPAVVILSPVKKIKLNLSHKPPTTVTEPTPTPPPPPAATVEPPKRNPKPKEPPRQSQLPFTVTKFRANQSYPWPVQRKMDWEEAKEAPPVLEAIAWAPEVLPQHS